MIKLIITVIYLLCGCSFMKVSKTSKEFSWWALALAVLLWAPILLGLSVCFWKPVSRFILKTLGWNLYIKPGAVIYKKSITIVAPHTSWFDAILGKMVLVAYDIPHHILSAKHLFTGPLGVFMKYSLRAIPVGEGSRNAIYEVAEFLKNHESNVVLCPEGHLKTVSKWNPGFILMAKKAECSITMVSIDYRKKLVSFLGSMDPEVLSKDEIWDTIRRTYDDVTAKHPDRFSLPIN